MTALSAVPVEPETVGTVFSVQLVPFQVAASGCCTPRLST